MGLIRVWIEGFLRGRYGFEGYRAFLVLAVAVVLVALIVVGGLMAPSGKEHTREHIHSFCEQLRETELNQIQRCQPDESTQPVTVGV